MGNLSAVESDRFFSKAIANSAGCIVWQGPLDRDGYGTFYLRRRSRRAHRVAWFNAWGEIAEGFVVNHKCKNRACVNFQHLECISSTENALRDSVSLGAVNARKTTCPRGHAYDGIYVNKKSGKTSRTCSTCHREKHARLRKKWRAEDTLKV